MVLDFKYKRPVKVSWGTNIQKNVSYGYFIGGNPVDNDGSITLINRVIQTHSMASEVSKVRGFEIPTILFKKEESTSYRGSKKIELSKDTEFGKVLEIHFKKPAQTDSYQFDIGSRDRQRFFDIYVVGEFYSMNSYVVNIVINKYNQEGGVRDSEKVSIPVSVIDKVRNLLENPVETI